MEKYLPLSPEEFNELNAFISTLGSYLPENKAHYVWSKYNRIRATNEPQPCTCGSSGAHWKRAIDFLTDWVNQRK
jgi:hypothetical protein